MIAQQPIHLRSATAPLWSSLLRIYRDVFAGLWQECVEIIGHNSMKTKANSRQMDLIDRAKRLARAGYSPIPVQGNAAPTEPKKPSVSWKMYQGQIAPEAEIERVFDEKVTALGIVCGRVSKLLVIDFDDLLRYQRFCRHLPEYSETYTVKTRRGFHLYFRTREKVPSHQFDGGDIKGEKSYIIAPPSIIGTFVYRPVKDVPERELEKDDVDRLLNYFHVRSSVQFVAGRGIREARDVDLTRLYQRLARRIGRNNALYRVVSIAREAGLGKAAVENELLTLHMGTAGDPGHKYESFRDRGKEGLRTIESAYRDGRSVSSNKVGIPNSIRERLLQSQGSTVMARLLDIFALARWEAEAYFTLADAVRLGEQYGLNRKSVLQGLSGDRCSFDGRHIISRRYVEYLDIRGFISRKRGRPVELVFQVPAVSRLLRLLNVGWSPCDCVGEEDVGSAKAYRLALHREYISRLAPRSSLAALAGRVGVNERTIRRYNRALEVRMTACVGRLKLTREVVATLPKRAWRAGKNTTNGFWLEAADGVRLPAWRHIGSRLLKAGGQAAQVCVRLSSVFSLEPGPRSVSQFENMSVPEFRRVLGMRGEPAGEGGLLGRLGDVVETVRGRAAGIRYEKIQLFFDSVAMRIADDKVAETISGYLFARDDAGSEVRRPARRGIAYRMLKEFGNGNVHLALRSSYREVMMSLARQALRAGEGNQSLQVLARKMA